MLKEQEIILQDGGEQKKFRIRQMPATKAEAWVLKMIFLLGGEAELDKLDDPIAIFNAIANKPFEKVQELLDKLLACVSRVHDGGIETQLTPDNVDGYVEDMPTLLKLRVEAFKFNNFFQKGGLNAFGVSPAPTTIPRKK